jgi:hypothetical protein
MTSAKDLMSLGLAWGLAQAEGFSDIAITAAGSATTDATVCDAQNDVFRMTATGADGIRMNTSTPLLQPIFISNVSGSTGKVYPATGGNFNGGSTDAAISVGANKCLIVMRFSTTGWLSNLSA